MTNAYPVRREAVLSAIVAALEASDDVTAVWEGGAAAFDRVDEWSDIDVMVAVRPDTRDEAIELVDRALRDVAPIRVRYRLPEPAWHGHSQVFYMLEGASPFEFVDICFMNNDTERRFLEPEVHGNALVHFDRAGFTKQEPGDPASLRSRLARRVETLRSTIELGRTGPLKELERGNDIEALSYYHATTLRPLVELLRIRHCPARHQFHTRYVQYDLPAEVVERLAPFFFVAGAEEIRKRHAEATAWMSRLLDELERELGDDAAGPAGSPAGP